MVKSLIYYVNILFWIAELKHPPFPQSVHDKTVTSFSPHTHHIPVSSYLTPNVIALISC